MNEHPYKELRALYMELLELIDNLLEPLDRREWDYHPHKRKHLELEEILYANGSSGISILTKV